jgi:hypothetical protein
MVMEAFSNTRSAYQFEKLRHEEGVVEGFPFHDTFGGQEISVLYGGATLQDGDGLHQGKQSISRLFHTIYWSQRVSI